MIITDIQHFSDIDRIKEGELYKFCDEYEADPDLGDDRIVISSLLYRLHGTSLLIAEGVYYRYDEDTGDFEQDFDVSLLYDSEGEPDLDRPLYWESGTPQSMFHDYAVMQQELGKNTRELLTCVA